MEITNIESSDGFVAFKDYSHMSEAELKHMIIDGYINLVQITGNTVEEEIEASLNACRMTKAMQGFFDES